MTDFDLDLTGVESLQAEFERLEEMNDDPPEIAVGTDKNYGRFLETGTRHMPPYPWFGPAIRELRLDPEVFLRKNQQAGFDDFDTVSELVLAYAGALKTQMEKNVTAQSAFGRSPGTHPEHPKVQTGVLRSSIGTQRLD